MGFFLKACVAAAAFPSLFVHATGTDPWMEIFDWTFNIDIQRYTARDCSSDKIGKRTYIKERECHSWVDDSPFAGYRYYVSAMFLYLRRYNELSLIECSGENIEPSNGIPANTVIAVSTFGKKPIALEYQSRNYWAYVRHTCLPQQAN